MRLLHGRRLDEYVVELPVLALVGEALVGGEGLEDDGKGFLVAFRRLLLWNGETVEFEIAVALAHAEIEAPAR